MVLTVQGTSQVPVYSGWVFSWVPLSFLWSSNVRSWLYLQCTQSPIQLRLEVEVLVMYSMFDLIQVFKTEIELAVVRNWTAVSIAEVSLFYWDSGWSSCFSKANSSPQLVVALCSFLSFTHLTSFFFTNEKKETHVTDISKLRSLSISSQQALWSSAVPERRPGLAVCTGLNQSGSRWAQVHLSQMLICRAQHWGQRRFTCIWCKITWAGTPSPSCLGFCLRPRERCDTSGRAKYPFAPPPRSAGSHSCG